MKRGLVVIGLTALGCFELTACMPAPPSTAYADSYQRDAKILEQYRKNWYMEKQEQQERFYLKQIILQLKELKTAIKEINKQLEKQKEINTDFASRIYALEREVSTLKTKINSININSLGINQIKNEIKTIKEEISRLFNLIKKKEKKVQGGKTQ